MAGVPFVFGNATTSIPLSNLDANFNTGLTIGNTTVGLGNTVTTLGNVTLNNVTINSGTSNVSPANVVATTLTIGGVALGAGDASIMKNRIINGAMSIAQYGTSTSIAAGGNSGYSCDRFRCDSSVGTAITSAQSTSVVPAGFGYSLSYTTGTGTTAAGDNAEIVQFIEANNLSDIGFGSANAKTLMLSFWARSSLTGSFGIVIENGAGTRQYLTTYSLPTANTWTQITIALPADTGGTWTLTGNGRGLNIRWDMGIGTSNSGASTNAWGNSSFYGITGAVKPTQNTGATFYITGVQLEVGSSATGFEYVNYQTSLANCQRYYQQLNENPSTLGILGFVDATTSLLTYYYFPVSMRTAPTFGTSGTASDYSVRSSASTVTTCSVVPTGTASDANRIRIIATVTAGLVAGQSAALVGGTTNGILNFSAEL